MRQLQRTRGPSIRSILMALALSVAGCVSVPFDHPKDASKAIPPSRTTTFGAEAGDWNAEHRGASGFLLLLDGIDALGVRVAMMRRAEVSIDAQYFLIKPDAAGGIFANELLAAADRGVRVRFLIDDIFTPNLDSELAFIDAHPNIEVRLFNPLSRQSFRTWSLIADFKRANRRMHNKSFTVDNSITIVGGRNIAAEYYQIHDDVEFVDLEILGLGPVAVDVSDTFDKFWNSALALPVGAFGKEVDEATVKEFRNALEEDLAAADTIFDRALTSPFLRRVLADVTRLTPAAASVVTDEPKKLKTEIGVEELQELALALTARADAARKEIIIITPYLVPRESGVEFLASLAAKGVRVRIITNSLASTNHVPVHSGYARYRKRMLEGGIELYEMRKTLSATQGEYGGFGATLHTKAMIFDRETLFVGSLNLDPRSIDINTEMGIFVESRELARTFAEEIDEALPSGTYRVALEEGELRWHGKAGDTREVVQREPQSSLWRRLLSGFFGMLPIEGQL